LASLYRIGQIINSSLVLDEVLNLVIDNLIEVTRAERGIIMLFDEKNELVIRAARTSDRFPLTIPHFYETSRNIVHGVAKSGVPRLINAASSDREYRAFQSVIAYHLQSILCAPLKVRDQVRGVLYVDNRLIEGAFTQDDLELLMAFAGQAAVAIENARIYEELARREGMRRELEIARSIQMSLMPRELPVVDGFELAGVCLPAREVGGDFYDAIATADGRIVVFLGDVSGKGVPAALLMGMVRTILRSEVERTPSLVDAVSHCNRILYSDFASTSMFATLVVGALDPTARTFRSLNCGHCATLLWHKNTDRVEQIAGDGLPLGILHDLGATEQVASLASGEVVLLYSDGFTEARSAKGELFGVERLEKTLRASARRGDGHILSDIGAAVARFTQGQPQSDDQTLLLLRATS
jgi:sigma-B regulation protein RsbU (phosphoserine phosphatase)